VKQLILYIYLRKVVFLFLKNLPICLDKYSNIMFVCDGNNQKINYLIILQQTYASLSDDLYTIVDTSKTKFR